MALKTFVPREWTHREIVTATNQKLGYIAIPKKL